jgi:hypothetical protein
VRRSRSVVRVERVIAFVITALLIANVVALENLPPERVQLQAGGVLAGEIAALQEFVERTRGLEFHKNVDIALVPAEQVLLEPGGAQEEDAEGAEQFALVLVALGWAEGPDAVLRADEALSEGVLGRYDPADGTLRVREGPLDDFTRSIIVHELTHALDDQHFGLARTASPLIADEREQSFRALAEGNASAVEEAYVRAHPEARKGREAIENAPPPDVPEALLALASYPYFAGLEFVEAVRRSGGLDAVNRAFDHPPVTSEQVLHPERYLRGEKALEVERPQPDGEVIDRGVLGELALILMLQPAVGIDAARAAADGWGGDRYLADVSGERVCLRLNVVADAPKELGELATAFGSWAAKHPGAAVTADGMIRVERCVSRPAS